MNAIDQYAQQINQQGSLEKKPKVTYLLITGIVLVCAIVFGFGGYYMGKQSSQPKSNIDKQANQPIPTSVLELKTKTTPSTKQKVGSLPPGWSYKDNGECGVKFAIPPKTEPYYIPYDPNRDPSLTDDTNIGRFWDFPRGAIYPNLLSKLPKGYENHKQAIAWYATTNESSGPITAAISVSCIPNEGNLKNQGMLNIIKTNLQDYNKRTGDKGMQQPDSYTIQSSKEVNRWGHLVVDLTVLENFKNSGGQPYTKSVKYTMFTTPKYIYEIRVLGASQDTFVKETATKIFNNLVF